MSEQKQDGPDLQKGKIPVANIVRQLRTPRILGRKAASHKKKLYGEQKHNVVVSWGHNDPFHPPFPKPQALTRNDRSESDNRSSYFSFAERISHHHRSRSGRVGGFKGTRTRSKVCMREQQLVRMIQTKYGNVKGIMLRFFLSFRKYRPQQQRQRNTPPPLDLHHPR